MGRCNLLAAVVSGRVKAFSDFSSRSSRFSSVGHGTALFHVEFDAVVDPIADIGTLSGKPAFTICFA
jgi:hypothetical protein